MDRNLCQDQYHPYRRIYLHRVYDWNVIAYVHTLRNGKNLPIYVANNIERHVTAGELLYSRVLDEEVD